MKWVYICSPYRGDVERNIAKTQGYSRFAVTQGVIPLAPHIYFTQFLDDDDHEERRLGLHMGAELLKCCQEVWVFGSRITTGMKGEIAMAEQLGISVHYYTDRCEKLEVRSA